MSEERSDELVQRGDLTPPVTTWERVKFIITNLKWIVLAGLVGWTLIILTLDIVGVIDLKVDCPSCSNAIDSILNKVVGSASAQDRVVLDQPSVDGAMLVVRVRILP
jgi:hypothetical protein